MATLDIVLIPTPHKTAKALPGKAPGLRGKTSRTVSRAAVTGVDKRIQKKYRPAGISTQKRPGMSRKKPEKTEKKPEKTGKKRKKSVNLERDSKGRFIKT